MEWLVPQMPRNCTSILPFFFLLERAGWSIVPKMLHKKWWRKSLEMHHFLIPIF